MVPDIIIRRPGMDDFRFEAPSYAVEGEFLVQIAPPVDWAKAADDPFEIVPVVELHFKLVGYEEYGREVLPIFEEVK